MKRARGPLARNLGIALCALFVLVALVGPLIASQSPAAQDLAQALAAPSRAHWLGTDENGADLLAELLFGARLALFVAGLSTLVSVGVGVAAGALAGFLGGFCDETIARAMDVVSALPGLVLNLAIVALVPRAGLGTLVLSLCATGWVGYARVARLEALALRDRDFVLASRALGARTPRLVARHLVPNLLGVVIVQAAFGFAGTLSVAASLSFLGLGAPEPYDWGALLAQGTAYLWRTGRLLVVPGVALGLVVLGCVLVGDGLRDHVDPRSGADRAALELDGRRGRPT